MEILQHLGLALGLASLAGLNLYLTVAITGLAIRFDFLQLATQHQQLETLGHPAIITVALVLFTLEFFADKIPWVDSLWDSVHTFVRPAGAVLVALPALGTPVMEVIGGLVFGVAAATVHATKASTRLIVNASPEPVSNIVVSVVEDVAVVGLWALVVTNPVLSFWLFLAALICLWIVMPRLLRVVRANAWLMWNKLRLPGFAGDSDAVVLPEKLTAEEDMQINTQMTPKKYTVTWAAPCISGRVKKLGRVQPNIFGKLVAMQEHPGRLVFVGRAFFRRFARVLDIEGCEVSHESKFLSENLVIYDPGSKNQATFRFKRGQDIFVAKLVEALRQSSTEPSATGSGEPVGKEAVGVS